MACTIDVIPPWRQSPRYRHGSWRKDRTVNDDKNKKASVASEALSDKQLDEVVGATDDEIACGRDVRLPKPYPPWPESN